MNNRGRQFTYVQQLLHLNSGVEGLEQDLSSQEDISEWAYIIHDEDETTDGRKKLPHVHVVIKYDNAHTVTAVAKHVNEKESQYIEYIKGKNGYNNQLSYLVHRTSGASEKHQYEVDKVRANFDYPKRLSTIEKHLNSSSSTKKLENVLNAISSGIMTYDEGSAILTPLEFSRWHQSLKVVWQRRQKELSIQKIQEREITGKGIDIIYLYGRSGTGKTSLAKRLAGDNYFFAVGKRDKFQGYQYGNVIIDDLKLDDFNSSELLQLLDNFGSGKADARYQNVQLLCDKIIITSIFTPEVLWRSVREGGLDEFEQLERRLTAVIELTDDNIVDAETGEIIAKNKYSTKSRMINGKISPKKTAHEIIKIR